MASAITRTMSSSVMVTSSRRFEASSKEIHELLLCVGEAIRVTAQHDAVLGHLA